MTLNNDVNIGLWSTSVEKLFLDVMVEEVGKGNMQQGRFSGPTWRRITEVLNTQGGRNFTLSQVKQKYNRLRTKHREYSDLLKHTGFGWNPETNTVNAEPDVWVNYLRANPHHKRYQTKGCPHYRLLGVIFNESTATGDFRLPSSQPPPISNEEIQLDDELRTQGVHVDVEGDDGSYTDPSLGSSGGVTSRSKKRILRSTGSNRKEMVNANIAMAEAITQMARDHSEISRAKLIRMASSKGPPMDQKDPKSITKAMEWLNCNMPDMDPRLYVSVCMRLKDAQNRDIFFNMPDSIRKFWVENKLDNL